MLQRNDEYECNHLPGERLKVVQRYNNKQFVLESDKTKKRHLVAVSEFTEPHLCLAHVSNLDCELRKIQKGLL